MAQISKLYKFYLKKIFKKNWLRIAIVSILLVGVVWFGIPYLFSRGLSKVLAENAENLKERQSGNNRRRPASRKPKIEIENFSDYNYEGFGNGKLDLGNSWLINRELLKIKISEFKEKKAAGANEEDLKEVKAWIEGCEFLDSFKLIGIDLLLFNADNALFFNHTEGYNEGKPFWKLLNDISWWNLTGFIFLFSLVFNVLDSVFSHPRKDGEEAMVLSFTPGVKRSDLFFAKILAFLTFYAIINFLLFILPYGFYYFWVAKEKSFVAFSILSLYTTIVGPILFFGLILTPYIFANAWSGITGGIISLLVSFFPMVWSIGKKWIFPLHTWPYTVEEKFFDPAIFTVISLICGVIFLSLYYWKYQEEDLG